MLTLRKAWQQLTTEKKTPASLQGRGYDTPLGLTATFSQLEPANMIEVSHIISLTRFHHRTQKCHVFIQLLYDKSISYLVSKRSLKIST